MTSFTAKVPRPHGHVPRRVVIVVYPGVTLLDAAGAAQVFSTASQFISDDMVSYEVFLASKAGGLVASDTGIPLGTRSLKDAATTAIDTLLVAGGLGVFDAARDNALIEWLRIQAPHVRRAGSTCMGAFLTAAAGMLVDRRVVTHWRWCEELQQRHPDVTVERDPIFVHDGRIWSSAGVSAGIDLALAMVEEDHGIHAALEVARSLVVYLKRPGGQSQFSVALTAQCVDHKGDFSALHAWIADNLDADLRVERLAERVSMSLRTFARVYSSRVGMTPAKTVEAMRVEAAKRFLEETVATVGMVAKRAGFQDDERMRRAFLRHVGVPPLEYRRRFGTAGQSASLKAHHAKETSRTNRTMSESR